jgi:hypothetical protein
MSRTLTLLTAAFLFCAAATAAPIITFEKAEHNFGAIEKGEKVTHKFTFRNTGDGDLKILDVKTSCGCTSAAPEKDSFAPGETGYIPVTFDSGRFSGEITKTVTVTSNSEGSPKTTLKIYANIRQEVDFKPSMVGIYRAKRTENIEREIRVSTDTMEKLEVTVGSVDLDFLEVKTERVDDKMITLKATLKAPEAPTGTETFRGVIRLKTNSEKVPEINVPVHVRFERPIRLNPGFISFYGTKKGTSRETTVQLTPTGDQAFNITSATADLDFLEIKHTMEDGTVRVQVKLKEGVEEGKFQGFVTVKTDLEEQPEIRIPVRGNVI